MSLAFSEISFFNMMPDTSSYSQDIMSLNVTSYSMWVRCLRKSNMMMHKHQLKHIKESDQKNKNYSSIAWTYTGFYCGLHLVHGPQVGALTSQEEKHWTSAGLSLLGPAGGAVVIRM